MKTKLTNWVCRGKSFFTKSQEAAPICANCGRSIYDHEEVSQGIMRPIKR